MGLRLGARQPSLRDDRIASIDANRVVWPRGVDRNDRPLRTITIAQGARINGVEAQVLEGLRPGERVILYPASDLTDGARVVEREAES